MKKYKNTLWSIYLYTAAGLWSFLIGQLESYCIFKIPESCLLKTYPDLHIIFTIITILVLFVLLILGVFISLKKSIRENLPAGIILGIIGTAGIGWYSWFLYMVMILGDY
ncbi:MAG: hypothetical protein AAB381_02425 [Patescibacteria group bacterium]